MPGFATSLWRWFFPASHCCVPTGGALLRGRGRGRGFLLPMSRCSQRPLGPSGRERRRWQFPELGLGDRDRLGAGGGGSQVGGLPPFPSGWTRAGRAGMAIPPHTHTHVCARTRTHDSGGAVHASRARHALCSTLRLPAAGGKPVGRWNLPFPSGRHVRFELRL